MSYGEPDPRMRANVAAEWTIDDLRGQEWAEANHARTMRARREGALKERVAELEEQVEALTRELKATRQAIREAVRM